MSSGFLIDTNVVSELRKGPRADAGVRAWFDEHKADQLWLSVLVIGGTSRWSPGRRPTSNGPGSPL